MMIQEFGFSLIVEAILNKVQKTPIIGHNLMYDVLYFYTQFIGNLPETYLEFLAEWNKCFPVIFDSKVIAYYNQQHFPKMTLGGIHESIEGSEIFKNVLRFKFDEKNEMTKYQPQPSPEQQVIDKINTQPPPNNLGEVKEGSQPPQKEENLFNLFIQYKYNKDEAETTKVAQ